jgi:hypothetical protein
VNTANGPQSGLTGRFANVREGGVAAVFGDLMLVLTYVGGDGNDVVLMVKERPKLTAPRLEGNSFVFSHATRPGHFYRIETTSDLGAQDWSPHSLALGTGDIHTITTPLGSEPLGFYRLRIW